MIEVEKKFILTEEQEKKYKKDNFNIDLDITDFGYKIVEIEKIVEKPVDMQKTTSEIMKFAERHGTGTSDNIYGKAVEYLRRNNPRHFQGLINAKAIK